MHIELLYFDDCPNWRTTRADLDALGDEIGFDVSLTRLTGPEDATAKQFLGSPSIRVNGTDILTTGQEQVGYACRLYEGSTNAPTKAALNEALETHRANNP